MFRVCGWILRGKQSMTPSPCLSGLVEDLRHQVAEAKREATGSTLLGA